MSEEEPTMQDLDVNVGCKSLFAFLVRNLTNDINYAVERFQAGRWGRFLSPDILGGSLMNPQSLNRYAYVLNNPCTLIDPLGLTPKCTFTASGGSNLPKEAKDEINRILGQAGVHADFVDGDSGDVNIVQNASVTEQAVLRARFQGQQHS
jgi:RHS repeat-associated protein